MDGLKGSHIGGQKEMLKLQTRFICDSVGIKNRTLLSYKHSLQITRISLWNTSERGETLILSFTSKTGRHVAQNTQTCLFWFDSIGEVSDSRFKVLEKNLNEQEFSPF